MVHTNWQFSCVCESASGLLEEGRTRVTKGHRQASPNPRPEYCFLLMRLNQSLERSMTDTPDPLSQTSWRGRWSWMVTKCLGPVSLTPNTEVSKEVTFSRSGSFWYLMPRFGLSP